MNALLALRSAVSPVAGSESEHKGPALVPVLHPTDVAIANLTARPPQLDRSRAPRGGQDELIRVSSLVLENCTLTPQQIVLLTAPLERIKTAANLFPQRLNLGSREAAIAAVLTKHLEHEGVKPLLVALLDHQKITIPNEFRSFLQGRGSAHAQTPRIDSVGGPDVAAQNTPATRLAYLATHSFAQPRSEDVALLERYTAYTREANFTRTTALCAETRVAIDALTNSENGPLRSQMQWLATEAPDFEIRARALNWLWVCGA